MQEIFDLLSRPFVYRLIIVGVLVSLCAALLGVSLVLKRYSMIGDGLSHVGFGALALSAALPVGSVFYKVPLLLTIPLVVIAAFLLLRLSNNSKIRGDAAIAIISTGSLAFGSMIITLSGGGNTEVCNYLFGSITSVTDEDVILSVVLSVIVIALFVFCYHKIFAVTFDETFAKATGVKSVFFNMLIALLTAVTIVLGMRMMGAVLISSLIIFPALTSMRICKTWKSVIICSAIVSVICFIIGFLISALVDIPTGAKSMSASLPTGATIVAVNVVAFLVFWVFSLIKRKIKR